MSEIPRVKLKANDFQGMATNIDPNDLRPGVARDQVNLMGNKQAELEVRRGLRKVTFEQE